MLYNPFEQVTKSSFRELVESGYADFVLQRFEWPDVKEKTGFLLTPNDDKEAADQHAHQLGQRREEPCSCRRIPIRSKACWKQDQAIGSSSIASRRRTGTSVCLSCMKKILSITCVPRPGFSAKIRSISYSP
ncbi:hypothetical protein [Sphingobacterium siyangense]|uniref:hypothetical protein n=1 Tax=Sphingobacterium siyangense TaxID=459529 RepID=UPI0028B0D9CB|nr:hypothetical protein [Sphingobacterium siyangense]